MQLSGVTERLSHGELAWFAGPKMFAMTADHHHDDRLAVWCAAPLGAQELLVQADPDRFFRPPYVGTRGWVGVDLDAADVDWDELAAILQDAYLEVAPKRLAAAVRRPAPTRSE